MNLVEETLDAYPGELVHVSKNRLHVEQLVEEQFPQGLIASELKLYNPDHSFVILPPKDSEEAQRPLHPPFLAARFEHMITEQGQKEIIKAWNGLKHVGFKHHAGTREGNRSSSPGLHLGVWEVQQAFPKVTRDTRLQTPETIEAIDRLFKVIGIYVVPKILALLKRYAPKQLDRQLR